MCIKFGLVVLGPCARFSKVMDFGVSFALKNSFGNIGGRTDPSPPL